MDSSEQPLQETEREFVVYVDGACWPNPGPGAAAASIAKQSGQVVVETVEGLEETTNMRAEYQALRLGVRLARLCGAEVAHFVTDSQVLAQQIVGAWTVQNDEIRLLHDALAVEIRRIDWWSVTFVPRAQNVRADWLCNTHMRPDDKRAKKIPPDGLEFRAGKLRPGWNRLNDKAA